MSDKIELINGSQITTIESGNNSRGNRSKFVEIYDDSADENKLILIEEVISEDGYSTHMKFCDTWDELEVNIKWDGCCDIVKYSNEKTSFSSVHVCDLKEFIDFLTEIYETAKNKDYEV